MCNYKCIISYDGSLFHGWAIQKDVVTIQETIQDELSFLFNQKINIFASGRTDKYVHALNQVFSFKVKDNELDPNIVLEVINKKLNTKGVFMKSCEKVSNTFHARFSAKNKTYMYVINKSKFDLFKRNYEYQYSQPINLRKLKKIAKLFIGKHNFLSFSTSEIENNVRTINYIKFKNSRNTTTIFINGDGFLKNMVRMIVSVFLKYNESKISESEILELFNNPKKGAAIDKVAGCGLYLLEVFY